MPAITPAIPVKARCRTDQDDKKKQFPQVCNTSASRKPIAQRCSPPCRHSCGCGSSGIPVSLVFA
jgi:hypothetical protein